MKENNMMSYEMYEDFKETMVKTIKAELSNKNRHPPELLNGRNNYFIGIIVR